MTKDDAIETTIPLALLATLENTLLIQSDPRESDRQEWGGVSNRLPKNQPVAPRRVVVFQDRSARSPQPAAES